MTKQATAAALKMPEGFVCKYKYNEGIDRSVPGFDSRDVVTILHGALVMHIPGIHEKSRNAQASIISYWKLKAFPQSITRPMPHPVDNTIDQRLRREHPENILPLKDGHVAYVEGLTEKAPGNVRKLSNYLELRLGVYRPILVRNRVFLFDDQIPKNVPEADIREIGNGHRAYSEGLGEVKHYMWLKMRQKLRKQNGIVVPGGRVKNLDPSIDMARRLRRKELRRKRYAATHEETGDKAADAVTQTARKAVCAPRTRVDATANIRATVQNDALMAWKADYPWAEGNSGNLQKLVASAAAARISTDTVIRAVREHPNGLYSAFEKVYAPKTEVEAERQIEVMMSRAAAMVTFYRREGPSLSGNAGVGI